MVDTIRALDRQIKLKHLVVDAFVPPKYAEMIEQSALWDSVNDRWVIGGLNYAANNIERVDQRHDFNPDANYAQYMDNQGTRGIGANFDPQGGQQEMTAEMEHRFKAALNNDASSQKEVFYSYGPEVQNTKKKNRPASAARNRRR